MRRSILTHLFNKYMHINPENPFKLNVTGWLSHKMYSSVLLFSFAVVTHLIESIKAIINDDFVDAFSIDLSIPPSCVKRTKRRSNHAYIGTIIIHASPLFHKIEGGRWNKISYNGVIRGCKSTCKWQQVDWNSTSCIRQGEHRKKEGRKESWLLGLIHGYLFHLQTVVRTERWDGQTLEWVVLRPVVGGGHEKAGMDNRTMVT